MKQEENFAVFLVTDYYLNIRQMVGRRCRWSRRARLHGHVHQVLRSAYTEVLLVSFLFRTKDKILYNKHAGHMLRTKLASADEGGVIAGVGALDSPYLVDCCD